jgi:dTDP-glucose 4,6-dehydratase
LKCILVTGGAGFIGSAVVRQLLAGSGALVVTLDCLSYAANRAGLDELAGHPRHIFEQADIRDAPALAAVFARHRPDAVMHLAAETHVDRSIDGPEAFVDTNVLGTCRLLEAARAHWVRLPAGERAAFRFHHVSTDEVFGSLGAGGAFHEATPYAPNSPYSASKAGADHLVRAWHATYGLPVVISNCSNNYGPRQFPEKLIPLTIIKALSGQPLPVYGRGENVRDWLHVEDHARALHLVLERGGVGESYMIGGRAERSNIAVVRSLCRILDDRRPAGAPHERLISFVTDRPGHDHRYAVDCAKIERELGWRPCASFEDGLARTVAWYLDNQAWWRGILDGGYGGGGYRGGGYRGERLGRGQP